ncbi:hypothetical protein EB796_010640 [Bugula neritina]|uniref:Uncharacterized protein n=1 Tax=Bugula neritina TaxID=10212 RepID=A0A7J7JYT1_BUGNE|nr:hypothetical protein EB796_010640 [Bugula neritina]
MLEKTQEKLKRKIREFTVKQSELVGIKDELSHLRNVQTIVQGVEKDVVKMLEEKVGYTPQQLTYVVLLRQQLSNSKKTCEKLKREIGNAEKAFYPIKVDNNIRSIGHDAKYESSEAELNLLKLELGKSEAHNLALEKKCKKLINSINSPSGVSVSLAKRIVHQSPAPMFITPSPSEKPSSVNEKLSEEDNLKTRLSYGNNGDEEDSYMPVPKVAKKSKYIESKSDLTQGRKDAGDVTPPVNQSALPIKPNNSLKFKAYRRKNVLQEFKRNKNSTYESKYFRHGFDGMGGQTQSYNRTQDAMQFNIFKKSAKRQEKTIPSTHKYIPEEVILIE